MKELGDLHTSFLRDENSKAERRSTNFKAQLRERESSSVLSDDLQELLEILGLPTHARPQSPHEVFQEALAHLRTRLASKRDS